MLRLQTTNTDNIIIIHLSIDALDATTSIEFKENLLNIIDSKASKYIILNMTGLSFIDSSGLGVLISILRICIKHSKTLVLTHMEKPVRALFELMRMHKVFEIYDTDQEVIDRYNDKLIE